MDNRYFAIDELIQWSEKLGWANQWLKQNENTEAACVVSFVKDQKIEAEKKVLNALLYLKNIVDEYELLMEDR